MRNFSRRQEMPSRTASQVGAGHRPRPIEERRGFSLFCPDNPLQRLAAAPGLRHRLT